MTIDQINNYFNWVDWTITLIIFVSTIISLTRGFFKEALSLTSWIAAFFVAKHFYGNVDYLLEQQISNKEFRQICSIAVLFLGTLISGALVSYIVSVLLNLSGLSSTDRLLGMIFGFARGIVIVTIIIGLAGVTSLTNGHWYLTSKLSPRFKNVADLILNRYEEKKLPTIDLGKQLINK